MLTSCQFWMFDSSTTLAYGVEYNTLKLHSQKRVTEKENLQMTYSHRITPMLLSSLLTSSFDLVNKFRLDSLTQPGIPYSAPSKSSPNSGKIPPVTTTVIYKRQYLRSLEKVTW